MLGCEEVMTIPGRFASLGVARESRIESREAPKWGKGRALPDPVCRSKNQYCW